MQSTLYVAHRAGFPPLERAASARAPSAPRHRRRRVLPSGAGDAAARPKADPGAANGRRRLPRASLRCRRERRSRRVPETSPSAARTPTSTSTPPATAAVALTFRLSNSSRYSSHDVWPRLVRRAGVRYPPDATEAPLAARLDAGEVRTTVRRFTLPSTARPAGFLVEHTDGPGAGPSLRCLIAGGSCWHASPPHAAMVLE